MEMHLNYIVEPSAFVLVGAALAIPFLHLNVKIAPKLGLIDWPKARGLTDEQIPIVGASLVLISLIYFGLAVAWYGLSSWFLTTASVVALMGFIDDRKALPALDKIFFQAICVVTVIWLDPHIHNAIIVHYGASGMFWGTLFILGLVNAINFIDGIDGLAAIVITFGSLGFLLISRPDTDLDPLRIYAALLIGLMGPFFYLNVRFRKGFLGNVGSYFFSYVLAMMHLSIPIESAGPVSRLSLSGLCFLIPIADGFMVVTSRLLTGRSPFQADKGHLHHKMIQTSIGLRQILIHFAFIEGTSLSLAFFLAQTPALRASQLPTFLCVSQMAVAAVLILLVEKASRKRVQTFFQKLEPGSQIYFLRYEINELDGRPVSSRTLRRIEARLGAEIRITDFCFAEDPAVLFVTLKAVNESIRGVISRLDAVFQAERVKVAVQVEQGEFVRVNSLEPTEKARRTGTA